MTHHSSRCIRVKKCILCSCGAINMMLFFAFATLWASRVPIEGAISQLCDRVEAGTNMQCRTVAVQKNASSCSKQCEDSINFGVENAKSLRPGIVDSDTDEMAATSGDWTSLLHSGEHCVMHFDGASTHHGGGYVDCSCTAKGSHIKILSYEDDFQRFPVGCTTVSWITHGPTKNSDTVDLTPDCLFLPATDIAGPELALGTSRSQELEKCQYWLREYDSNSYYHWLYCSVCVMFGWFSFVNCFGLGAVYYREATSEPTCSPMVAKVHCCDGSSAMERPSLYEAQQLSAAAPAEAPPGVPLPADAPVEMSLEGGPSKALSSEDLAVFPSEQFSTAIRDHA
eukprot:TRINITY_DN1832_c0_g1_i2.p1 TRINITY_DN1832_c0_g1~~TRINITY_DN1832_c0_g1_i2.p1  ORF type:complete len:340 (-),score=24.32 TRINITY_DN1832_c0_g1_i2:437-1456(-)